jgi:hypothetical protein
MCTGNCNGCSDSNCTGTNLPVITGPQGPRGQDGLDGASGPQGFQGYIVTAINIVAGDLEFTLSDPATGAIIVYNAGAVPIGVGPAGPAGATGPHGPAGSPAGMRFQSIPLVSNGITALTAGAFTAPAHLFATNDVDTFLTTEDSTVNYYGFPLFIYPGTTNHLKPSKLKLLVQADDAGYVGRVEIVSWTSPGTEASWLVGGGTLVDGQGATYVTVAPGTTEPVVIDLSDFLADGRFSTFWGAPNADNIALATGDTIVCIRVRADDSNATVGQFMSWISLLIEY